MSNKNKDTEFLYKHYHKCKKNVDSSPFFCSYADEKIKHSMQVVGATNYLLKHEKTFLAWTPQLRYTAWQACLFHDIGRFQEIEKRFFNQKDTSNTFGYDHGYYGYEILRASKQYASPEIIIPVRYHGKLDADFYADQEYQQLPKREQKIIEEILFLVKDADKIANFYLMQRHPEYYSTLVCNTNEINSAPSPEVVLSFQKHELCHNVHIRTPLDLILRMLSWIFDLNYQSSFDYLRKLDCIEAMLGITQKHNTDKKSQEIIEKSIKSFITNIYSTQPIKRNDR